MEIKDEEVLLILYPIIKDIIYSCNIAIERSYEFFIKNKDKLNKIIGYMVKEDTLFKKMYPSIYEKVDLIDRLIDSYNYIPSDIEVRYEMLKDAKRKKLEELVEKINNRLNTKLSIRRLIDDKVFVKNLDKESIIEDSNCIALVSKDGKLYKYNKELDQYENTSSEIICKDKVKELSLKR